MGDSYREELRRQKKGHRSVDRSIRPERVDAALERASYFRRKQAKGRPKTAFTAQKRLLDA